MITKILMIAKYFDKTEICLYFNIRKNMEEVLNIEEKKQQLLYVSIYTIVSYFEVPCLQ